MQHINGNGGSWIKEVENPVPKPLSQWRDELYGYWMVATDSRTANGIKSVIARYYGTDMERIYAICGELCAQTEEPDAEVFHNVKSNWMGGAFLVKAGS
jgi:hypothetical protein